MFWKNLNHKDVRVYQNRHILSFKFLKLNLSTKGSTVFIKIVDCFSKRVDPFIKKGWPFRQKGLTFSSKKVDPSVKKGWPFRQKGLAFLSTKRICLFWHTPILDYINDSNLFLPQANRYFHNKTFRIWRSSNTNYTCILCVLYRCITKNLIKESSHTCRKIRHTKNYYNLMIVHLSNMPFWERFDFFLDFDSWSIHHQGYHIPK